MIPSLHFMDGTTITELSREINNTIVIANDKGEPIPHNVLLVADALAVIVNYMNGQFYESMEKVVEKKKEHLKTIRELWNETPSGEAISDKSYRDLVDYVGQNHKYLFGEDETSYESWTRLGCWDVSVPEAIQIVEKKIKRAKEWEEHDRRASLSFR